MLCFIDHGQYVYNVGVHDWSSKLSYTELKYVERAQNIKYDL